jgi:hypothetical protein
LKKLAARQGVGDATRFTLHQSGFCVLANSESGVFQQPRSHRFPLPFPGARAAGGRLPIAVCADGLAGSAAADGRAATSVEPVTHPPPTAELSAPRAMGL